MTGHHPERDLLAGIGVAGAVSYLGAVEPVAHGVGVALDLAKAGVVVVRGDRAPDAGIDGGDQWTIFESGISIRSVAPAVFSSGISRLIWSLATTVSTA